jgi:CheY-like chemotaxis protein
MKTTINILLVEDDADDIELFKKALDDNGVNYSLEEITAGDGMLRYLKTHRRVPDVIVMDLNLPKVHGKDVLREIKTNERFKNVPLLVLTTSKSQEDIDFTERYGVDGFVTKPTTIDGFNETVAIVRELATAKNAVTR